MIYKENSISVNELEKRLKCHIKGAGSKPPNTLLYTSKSEKSAPHFFQTNHYQSYVRVFLSN